MSDDIVTMVVASVIGIVFTVIARLVDRYLPDPKDKHPLPDPPLITTTTQVTKALVAQPSQPSSTTKVSEE